jgi:hypothetical protein
MVTPHYNIDPVPGPRVHIEPVLGDIVEIRLASVGSMLYAVVIEVGNDARWTLCYTAHETGYELLWMILSVDWSEWLDALEVDKDSVVDVSWTVDEDIHMLAITQDVDEIRVVMFFRFDEEMSRWDLHLVLHFDLSNWTGSPFLECDSPRFDDLCWDAGAGNAPSAPLG